MIVILISTNAVGVAKGHEAKDIRYDYLLTTFVPLLRKAGVTDEQIRTLLGRKSTTCTNYGHSCS